MQSDKEETEKCLMPNCDNPRTSKQSICQECIDKENSLPPKLRERRLKKALEIVGEMRF